MTFDEIKKKYEKKELTAKETIEQLLKREKEIEKFELIAELDNCEIYRLQQDCSNKVSQPTFSPTENIGITLYP